MDISGYPLRAIKGGRTLTDTIMPSKRTVHRESWDHYFLELAKKVSERSTCERATVGRFWFRNIGSLRPVITARLVVIRIVMRPVI